MLQSTFEEEDKAEEEINEWLRQDFSGKTSKPNPETRTLHAGMSVRPDKKRNSVSFQALTKGVVFALRMQKLKNSGVFSVSCLNSGFRV